MNRDVGEVPQVNARKRNKSDRFGQWGGESKTRRMDDVDGSEGDRRWHKPRWTLPFDATLEHNDYDVRDEHIIGEAS